MRALILVLCYFLFFKPNKGQDDSFTEEVPKLIKLCSVCTCSEIPDYDGAHLVFNIQCSELDRIEDMADLDKIEWPDNPNGLKISATFESLGITTLSKLPPSSQVETLRFTNNAIKTYWPDPFSDVPNLKRLSFAQNDLVEITPDLFTNIERLEDLDLSYNRLINFNPLDFKSLHNVRRFNLQSNKLKKIPLEALQPMTALEDLDLSKNGIYDVLLSRNDGNALKGVKRLNLNGNRIRSITEDSFKFNNSIELLDLSNNIIEIIEKDAFMSCTNLRELNLAQNNITLTFNLPPYLQIAIFKVNTMFHWPTFPKGITYIDISYNRITEMYDENNVDFDHLEILNIGGNQIKDLNITKKVPKLFSLDLSYNLFTEVPKTLSFQLLPSLEELRLDGNPIENIYFKNIVALRSLFINDLNGLTVVEDKAFSNVVGRPNEETEKECFTLFLSNCPSLIEIKEGAFDGTTLCMLDISKNNLTHLSKNLLDWSKLSDGANLQWNPWHCGCELQWLLDDLLPKMYRSNSMLLSELRCGSPRAFEGLRLVHWYNWTEQAMCDDVFLRSGPHGTYLLEPSRSQNPGINPMTIFLAACIVIGVFIAIGLMVYLVKTRRRYRARRAAMKRKRQRTSDARSSNGLHNEQFSALNKI